MRHDPREELSWQAFRYVAGELSGDELTGFEALLSDDQQAREAVAEAVELAGSIALVAAEPLPLAARENGRPIRRWGVVRQVAWMAVGAAACIAVLLSGNHLRLPRPAAPEQAALPSSPIQPEEIVPAVALAWTQFRGSPDSEWASELMSSSESQSLSSDIDPTGAYEDTASSIERSLAVDDREVLVPSWLLAAASLDPALPGMPEESEQ